MEKVSKGLGYHDRSTRKQTTLAAVGDLKPWRLEILAVLDFSSSLVPVSGVPTLNKLLRLGGYRPLCVCVRVCARARAHAHPIS